MRSKLPRIIGSVAAGLLVAAASLTANAQSPPSPIAITLDALKPWDAFASNFLTSKNSNGGTWLATPIPTAARLHIRYKKLGPQGHPIACSGVLVGAMEVATAAHCVCGDDPQSRGWYYSAFKDCSPQLDSITAEIFFPTRGIFRSASISIHPDYVHPSASAADATRLGDIAIIHLDRNPDLDPAVISAPSTDNRHVMAGFGKSSISTPLPGFPFHANTTYLAGLAQIAFNKRLRTGTSCGGHYNLKDVLCLRYDSVADVQGDEQDFVVCPGDSGAPLFDVSSDGRLLLVGIASFFAGGLNECQPTHSGVSFFESASYYAAWIQQKTSRNQQTVVTRTCHESVVNAPTHLKLKFAATFVSLSTTGPDYQGAPYPKIELVGASAGSCDLLTDAGFGACTFASPVEPEIRILGEGAGQFVACSAQ